MNTLNQGRIRAAGYAALMAAVMAAGTAIACAEVAHAADISTTTAMSGSVPAGACWAAVLAVGGSGYLADPGPGGYDGFGGYGGRVSATLPVTAGDPFAVLFAPGGAPGTDLGLGDTGGRGGDASAASFGGKVLIAAGGGGGSGGSSGTGIFAENGFAGGNAGILVNQIGEIAGQRGDELFQLYDDGQGGFNTGQGGEGHPEASNGMAGTSAPGSIGKGGAGGAGDPGTLVTPSGPGGGGGGAGYKSGAGGGGGANNRAYDADNQAGGGGGGNSYIDPSAVQFQGGSTSLSNHTASVTIEWLYCPIVTTTTTTTTTTMPIVTTTTEDAAVTTTTGDAIPPVVATTTTQPSSGGRSLPATGSGRNGLMTAASLMLLLGSILIVRAKRPV